MLVQRGDTGLARGLRPATWRSATRSASAAMCSGVVPQQPPTSDRPNSLVNLSWASASCVRGQRVVRAVRGEHGQAGVRLAGDRDPGVRGQVAQVLAHLAGAGGAVQPDHVDAERLQGGERGGDLAAEQHGPGRLDRDLGDDQRVRGQFGHGPLGADDGRLGLEQVLAGLDDQRVGAAAQQALRVGLVGVAQLAERGVAERGQLGARADRAEHPAWAVRRGPAVGGGAGQPGGRLGQLHDPLGDAVLAEIAQVGAERVGGDAIRARVQVSVVDPGHDIGPGHVQDLVAALVACRSRRRWRRSPGAWCPWPRPPPRPAQLVRFVECSLPPNLGSHCRRLANLP